jgi:hypothetical protein
MSLPRTVACADQIMRATIDTYFAPNKKIRELNELMKSGAGIDPLKSRARGAAGVHLAVGGDSLTSVGVPLPLVRRRTL